MHIGEVSMYKVGTIFADFKSSKNSFEYSSKIYYLQYYIIYITKYESLLNNFCFDSNILCKYSTNKMYNIFILLASSSWNSMIALKLCT